MHYHFALCFITVLSIIVVLWLVLLEDKVDYFQDTIGVIKTIALRDEFKIPRVICQTNSSWAKIPSYVHQQFADLAPNFRRRFFNDSEASAYIKLHYPAAVQETYAKLKGAHKADLFRYCHLYKEGGVYLDIKTVLHAPLEEVVTLVENNKCQLATCLTKPVILVPLKAQVYQGVILALPGATVFLDCIKYILKYWWRTRIEYMGLIRNISARLLAANDDELSPGVSKDGQTLFLIEKVTYFRCHGEFGLNQPLLARSRKTFNCSVIVCPGGKILFGTRFPCYPWKTI